MYRSIFVFLVVVVVVVLCSGSCSCSCLSIYLSIDRSISQSIDLSICRSVDLSTCRSVDLSICRSVDLSICLSVYLSICLSVYLSIYRSIDLSIYRSIDLSIYRSIYLSLYSREKSDARSYEVLHLSCKIIFGNLKISKMQPVSGNPCPDHLTSLMNMSLVLRLPRDMHLYASSSNVPRLPSFLDMLQNKSQNALVRGHQLCTQLSIFEGSLAELLRF